MIGTSLITNPNEIQPIKTLWPLQSIADLYPWACLRKLLIEDWNYRTLKNELFYDELFHGLEDQWLGAYELVTDFAKHVQDKKKNSIVGATFHGKGFYLSVIFHSFFLSFPL